MSDFLIVGDLLNEFCGQHTAQELTGNRILMFDNGNVCLGPREEIFGQFSRVVDSDIKNASQKYGSTKT